MASFEQFVAAFDWAKVNTVGPIFDLTKLNWLNGEYIRALDPDDLAGRIVEHLQFTGEWSDPDPADEELLRRATPLIQERLEVLSEALPKLAFLFTADADLEVAEDARGQLGEDAAGVLDAAIAPWRRWRTSTRPVSRPRSERRLSTG